MSSIRRTADYRAIAAAFTPVNSKPNWDVDLSLTRESGEGLIGLWDLSHTYPKNLASPRNNGSLAGSGGTGDIVRAVAAEGQVVRSNANNNNIRIDLGSVGTSNPLIGTGDGITILARVKISTTGTLSNTFPRIFDKSSGGVGANGYYLGYATNTNQYEFLIDSNSTGYPALGTTRAQAAQWHTIAISWRASDGAYTFLDSFGNESTGTYSDVVPSVQTNAALLNWNHSTDRAWDGDASLVAVWNKPLQAKVMSRLAVAPYALIAADPLKVLPAYVPAAVVAASPYIIAHPIAARLNSDIARDLVSHKSIFFEGRE